MKSNCSAVGVDCCRGAEDTAASGPQIVVRHVSPASASCAASRDSGLAALSATMRAVYSHGVDAGVAVVEATFTALELRLTARVAVFKTEDAALRTRHVAERTTSSKPPNTDATRRVRPMSRRERSGRRPSGQHEDLGETLV